MDLWQIYRMPLSTQLLTQNHIISTKTENNERNAHWAKLLIISIDSVRKTENQMTYKRIIHKYYGIM